METPIPGDYKSGLLWKISGKSRTDGQGLLGYKYIFIPSSCSLPLIHRFFGTFVACIVCTNRNTFSRDVPNHASLPSGFQILKDKNWAFEHVSLADKPVDQDESHQACNDNTVEPGELLWNENTVSHDLPNPVHILERHRVCRRYTIRYVDEENPGTTENIDEQTEFS